jgi:PST family polysaccharide transporter
LSTPDVPPASEPPARSLGSIAARGAVTTITGQVARIGIQLGGLLILTRLLSIEDYGVFAMVTVVIGIGEVFRDFGLSTAAVQASTLSRPERANLFWLNAALGLALALVGFLAAPLVAFLYGDDRLLLVMQILASTFLLNGLSAQYRADLNRSLRFAALATVDVTAAALGLGTAIALALLGFGYWSLVAQQVVYALLAVILVAILAGWFPGWVSRKTSIRPLVTYGSHLVVSQLITYIGRNADTVILGARLGAAPLGLYNRAFQFILLPLNQINAPATKVAVPVLSRLRDDKERFDAFILHGQTVLLHVLVAAFAFAAAVAQPLIVLLLTEKWAPLVPVFQVLTVVGVARAASYPTYWVALSKGLTKVSMRLSIVSAPLLVLAAFVGSFWGVMAVAVSVAIVTLALWPIGLWIYGRHSDAPVKRMFVNGCVAILGYGVCALGAFLVMLPFGQLIEIARLGIGLGGYATTFVLVLLVWPTFRRSVVAVIKSRSLLR